MLGTGHEALVAENRERGVGGLQGLGARLQLGVGCPKLDCDLGAHTAGMQRRELFVRSASAEVLGPLGKIVPGRRLVRVFQTELVACAKDWRWEQRWLAVQ